MGACVCFYVHVCLRVDMSVCMCSRICRHVCLYACVPECVNGCLHVCVMCIRLYTRLGVCLHLSLGMCVAECVNVCMRVYARLYKCTRGSNSSSSAKAISRGSPQPASNFPQTRETALVSSILTFILRLIFKGFFFSSMLFPIF